jgi:DNA-binding response OmpR family regulator
LENRHKILIVDDDVSIRRVVELKLKNHGYQVITASNGEDGLKQIHKEKPDAVVTDINMPRMDGKCLCERSNPLKAVKNFLTIVLTARISPGEHRWIEKMQETQLMPKPFSPSKLVAQIDQYFDNKL